MKAGSLALLLVSKLAEVGVKNYSRNFESESVTYQSFNQTCLCQCHCGPPTSLTFTLIIGLLLGLSLGVWASWAFGRLDQLRVHGSSSSPRRRGGGIVIVPPRPAVLFLLLVLFPLVLAADPNRGVPEEPEC